MTPVAGDPLTDARLAARLCARDRKLGGLLLRGDGGLRDAALAALTESLPAGAPVRRLPVSAGKDALLGGLDLASALAGRGVWVRPGLLGAADGGMVVVPMAERLSPAAAASLGAALDDGAIAVERDGATLMMPARVTVAALDDGEGDERAPPALAERLAFWFDLDARDRPYFREGGDPAASPPSASGVPAFAGIRVEDDDTIELLARVSAALGIDSARAAMFALRTARGAAALDGRDRLDEADLDLAVRLVLAPRATRLPSADPETASEPPPADRPEDDGNGDEGDRLEDRLLEAAHAALPADLLARLGSGRPARAPGTRARGAGERRRSLARGRPAGTRAGEPRGGARLALIETLRTATPWQRLRGRTDRVLLRRSDLRVRRYQARPTLVTIFAVDASGSAAAARLAEAKGAVELLLAQAYVQRAEVALVAFRGSVAELLLPPTRSLARARRALAELPGGGGTPLAGGLEQARQVAEAVRAKGHTPFLVVLSDGRANIAADGNAGRAAAQRDALAAAQNLRVDGLSAVFIDTSARAQPEGARIAEAMGARYVALPYAGAAGIEAAVGALAPRRG